MVRLMDRGGVLERFGKLASCLALVLLVGCGQSSQPAGVSASGSPTSTLAVGVFGRCRLPVIVPHTRTQDDPRAGWLDVPAGTYSPDPSSNLAGATMLAWDAGVGKWVPTEPQFISPDGMSYVAENVPGIEIVDARTGDIVQRTPTGELFFRAVGYTRSAVYLVSSGQSSQPGLWKVDNASGKLTQLSSAKGDWEVVDDAAAWGTSTTPDNIVTVKRLDLSTGVVTDVYRPADLSPGVLVVGFAGAGVLVISSHNGGGGNELSSVVVVHPDGSVAPVDVPAALQHAAPPTSWLQDGPAVLFNTSYPLDWPQPPAGLHGWGLAAFDPGHGLQLLMKNTPADMVLLGRCISP